MSQPAEAEDSFASDWSFSYSGVWRWRVRAGIAGAGFISCVAIYSALMEPPMDREGWIWLAVVGVAAILAGVALVWYHQVIASRFVAAAEGLSEWRGDRLLRRLPWSDVRALRFRRLPGLLEVPSMSNAGRMLISDHIDGYRELVEYARTRSGHLVETVWL